ncbi:MAG: leucyl aminopeptidase family protein [Pseudomonadota bacterium]|nr:leucyl aminopeptidase family protein [Pseudomonadota bacterium]
MTQATILADGREQAVPIHAVPADDLSRFLEGLSEPERRFVSAQGFKAEAGRFVAVPDRNGDFRCVLFGLGTAVAAEGGPMSFGKLASALPEGTYRLAGKVDDPELSTLAFALGGYRFDRYRKPKSGAARLVTPEGVEMNAIARIRDGVFLARDLINTPANDLSPHDLARAAAALAARFGASISVIDGETLARDFPMVHAVGAGSDRPPCLIDLRWGAETDPKVTLVGKGVVFDTGGLDIKPASGMALMKKDMGGAANVLGLASMIMDAGLPMRLRVIIPAAENAISGRAFRPGDILTSRNGLRVEIGNTDAEGRLVLADALALADEEAPDLIVTMATLTGAARVALGPELPPFYTDDDAFAEALAKTAAEVHDPMWRMPLWKPYDAWLSSKVADLNHIAGNTFAGSIVAALFLRRFVSKVATFAHFDIFAWNNTARPAGPEGGEAQAIRALFRCLQQRFG